MIKCWYHSADLDGKCAGAIVKFVHPEAVLYPIDYGAMFPYDEVDEDDLVYMVDFCLQPFDDMIKLAESVEKLVWIDHHKSNIEAFIEQIPKGREVFSANTRLGIGACQLVWEYLLPQRKVPYAIQLVAQADVNDWEDPNALPFKYALSARETEPTDSIWKVLFAEQMSIQGLVDEGRLVMAYGRQVDKDSASEISFEATFSGLRLIMANKAKRNSGFLYSVYDPKWHDAMACFYWKKNRWLIDFYTKDETLDLGAMCRKWGGGGHKKAAGMALTPHVMSHFNPNPFKQFA